MYDYVCLSIFLSFGPSRSLSSISLICPLTSSSLQRRFRREYSPSRYERYYSTLTARPTTRSDSESGSASSDSESGSGTEAGRGLENVEFISSFGTEDPSTATATAEMVASVSGENNTSGPQDAMEWQPPRDTAPSRFALKLEHKKAAAAAAAAVSPPKPLPNPSAAATAAEATPKKMTPAERMKMMLQAQLERTGILGIFFRLLDHYFSLCEVVCKCRGLACDPVSFAAFDSYWSFNSVSVLCSPLSLRLQ